MIAIPTSPTAPVAISRRLKALDERFFRVLRHIFPPDSDRRASKHNRKIFTLNHIHSQGTIFLGEVKSQPRSKILASFRYGYIVHNGSWGQNPHSGLHTKF
jgi:hypothetical protein